jgi:D-amino-acid dehydrogenase
VIGERGYSVQSAQHAWPDHLPPTVFEERSMVVSRFDSGLRASSFLEFGRPDAPGDPRKWRTLERNLADLGIAFSETPDRWVGPRPTLPDYLPAIGRLADAPNLFYAFGHQHLGLTLSAVTSEIIAALATDKPPPVDVAPFRIERFA